MLARLQTADFGPLLRFFKDRKGSVVPLLGLAVVPLIGSVGAAVDYSRANSARTAMQAALDAGAIIATKQAQSLTGDALTASVNAYFNANFDRPDVSDVTVSAKPASDTGGSS